jgi:hypothetical protein
VTKIAQMSPIAPMSLARPPRFLTCLLHNVFNFTKEVAKKIFRPRPALAQQNFQKKSPSSPWPSEIFRSLVPSDILK